jgi:sphingolipid delta-4 desaturase
MEYIFTQNADPHIQRRKDMLKKYPTQIRALMGNHTATAFWVLACVGSQFAIAYLLREQALWINLLTAFCFGAFVNHALYVLIHEATHNLIFKSSLANRAIGMICDFPLVAPGSMAFRKYHLIHHVRQGQHAFDADLVSDFEANLVGNHWFKKMLWVSMMAISQGMRPTRITSQPFWDKWIIGNLLLQLSVMVATFFLIGPMAIVYLGFSTLFGLGIHPLGGRWIAEHYVIKEGQETYSYYGPLSPVIFNVGYHNEHHDIMTIAWKNLPKLKALAPEFYDTLEDHKSYPGLLWRFIWDPKMHLKSRVTRPSATERNAMTDHGYEKSVVEPATLAAD